MKFQAGEYFIGDVSYVVRPKDWQTLLRINDDEDGCQLRGHNVFFAGTCGGDGPWKDQVGRWYSTDTGTLGIIPVSLCLKSMLKRIAKRGNCGHVIKYYREFDVTATGGNFKFGDIVVFTDGSDDEDEDGGYCEHCGRG